MNAASNKVLSAEALLPNGENLSFLSPELGTFMNDLRAKVEAARAWPVAGKFSAGYAPSLPLFQRLPSEIRQRIYTMACYHPRVVEVTCHDKATSRTPVPAVFHACSESRKMALKIYEPLVLDHVVTGTFVNWTIDTIFVNDLRAGYGRSKDYTELHEKCRKLALPSSPFASFHLSTDYKNIECLTVVLKVPLGDGNIMFAPSESNDEATSRPRQDLVSLWELKRIKSYVIRDAVRGRDKTILDPKHKVIAQKKREKERKFIEPIRSDEDVAIRLQYDLDHGLID